MNYEDLLRRVKENGIKRTNRTGVDTRQLFGAVLKYNLMAGFPLITTKRVFFKAVVHELLWFISGSTNVKYLRDNGITIWDEWADENGELGPVYGKQWRNFNGVDQLLTVQDQIIRTPDSRRLIMNAWNPPDIVAMALPPCHMMCQFNVDGVCLDLAVYQRSADMFLGVPFNIASYALLLTLMAATTNLLPRNLTIFFGDCHIYENHLPQVTEQLSRPLVALPWMAVTRKNNIVDYVYDDVMLSDYDPHPALKGDVAV